MRDWFAMSMTKFFRFFADTFFAKRYGLRAVVLETVAGVTRYGSPYDITHEKFTKNENRLWPHI